MANGSITQMMIWNGSNRRGAHSLEGWLAGSAWRARVG
uniref:Uncharacterized protein n=1 Tax=Arundo donax TaxID=35708 RepID=A0A0A9AIC5_ARUDO